eukprot:CAMPEP_0174964290 /NCGR_PEP_ID=MMETSP0004_2-20121128/5797_1 /TAXON_ID=420556 /ORGANISM="Ochromonas sp., Strain CCMP1393" /LENGTH=403 /DNA_ID=CAMNT_0016212997 /DNA_START=113 /DNA_END=1324 /DNA_ORIENTATION=+
MEDDENEGHDTFINIPESCYKDNLVLETEDDVRHLLSTLRFWIVEQPPAELLEYLDSPNHLTILSNLVNDMDVDTTLLRPIRRVIEDLVPFYLEQAILQGRIDALCHFLEGYRLPLSVNLGIAAARGGQLECLKLLCCMGCPIDSKVCCAAAEYGHLECMTQTYDIILEQLVIKSSSATARDKSKKIWHESMSFTAALHGQLECLIYAFKLSEKLPASRINQHLLVASGRGRYRVVKYLVEEQQYVAGSELNYSSACEAAASGGHIDCLEYLLDWESHFGTGSIVGVVDAAAAHKGQLHCLKWLHICRGIALSLSALESAARGGQLHCLEYIHQEGGVQATRSSRAIADAAYRGHLDCLTYLHEHAGVKLGAEVLNAVKMSSANNKSDIMLYVERALFASNDK